MLIGKRTTAGVAQITREGERRRHGRVYGPFPSRVRGVARSGETFSLETVVDNVGAGGLYLRVPLEVDPDQPVRSVVRFNASGADGRGAARLWIKGSVLRSEPQPDGRYGLAIGVKNYRFL